MDERDALTRVELERGDLHVLAPRALDDRKQGGLAVWENVGPAMSCLALFQGGQRFGLASRRRDRMAKIMVSSAP